MTYMPPKHADSAKPIRMTAKQRAYFARSANTIYPQHQKREDPKVVLTKMTAALAAYQPTTADLNTGWWLNNAILHKMGLKHLRHDGCSWIEGDPKGAKNTDLYCGARRSPGQPYCKPHARRVWQKPKPQETSDNG